MGEALDQINATVETVRRAGLEALLSRCTEKQRRLFERIFPDGVPAERFDEAVRLVERTLKQR